jgi:hypothetical protein
MATKVGSFPKKANSSPARSWRHVISIHPAAELFDLLPEAELRELGESIRKNGLTSPITIHKDGTEYSLLDGRNRLDAMELVGIPFSLADRGTAGWKLAQPLGCSEFLVKLPQPGIFTGDPYEYVLAANIHRRHLTTERRLQLVDAVIKAKPDLSARQVARQTKVSPTTIIKRRKKLESKGHVSTMDTSIDTRGRKQPRTKSASKGLGPLVLLDPETTEPPAGDRRAQHTVVNGSPRHSGSGDTTTSGVAIAARLLADLYAQVVIKKVDPAKVAKALGLKEEQKVELFHWLADVAMACGVTEGAAS